MVARREAIPSTHISIAETTVVWWAKPGMFAESTTLRTVVHWASMTVVGGLLQQLHTAMGVGRSITAVLKFCGRGSYI